MTKKAVRIDPALYAAAERVAQRDSRTVDEVAERALENYLGRGLLQTVWARSALSAEGALRLANQEIHRWRGS